MNAPLPLRSATLLLLLLSSVWTAPAAFGRVAPAAEPARLAPDEGDDQYRLIAGLAERGMHAMVVREGEAFLRDRAEHPKRDYARYRLATAYFELGQAPHAVPHLRTLDRLPRFEFAPEVAFRLGQCELAAGDFAAARQAFDRAAASGKDYLVAHARFLSADAAFQAGDYPAAERGYADVLRLHAQGEYARDASSGYAWCAWKLGNTAEAVKRIEKHLATWSRPGNAAGKDQDPYAAELGLLLGEARLDAGDAKGALAAYRAVNDAEHADAAQRGAAHALAALGDFPGAAAAFGALLERSPDGPFAAEAALFRGVYLVRAGDSKSALAALSHRAAGNGPEVLYWRARAQIDTQDQRGALATLDRALAANEDQDEDLIARLQLARGDVLTALGREDEAIASYRSAGSDYALHAAAVAALNEGNAAEAARAGEELLASFPNSEYAERTRVVVGEAWFQVGDRARARKALAGLERSASDPALRARAASRLAWCAYQDGDRAAAAQAFGAIARDAAFLKAGAPEAEEAAYMEGRAAEEAGDEPGAVRAWRGYLQAFRAGASRAEVLAGLGRVEELGRAAQALEALAAESPQSPLLPRALYDVAERASAAGDLDVAAACYAKLLALPAQAVGDLAAPGRYGLGWCAVQKERYADAGAELARARDERGAAPELRAAALELEVWAWRKAGDAGRSAQAWRLLADAPGVDEQRLFEAGRTAALALQESGQAGEAQRLMSDLLRRVRTEEVAIAALIEGTYLALEAGDVDRAEAQVAVAKKRESGDPNVAAKLAEASFFVGEARFGAGAHDRARGLYEAGSAPGSPVRAQALYKLGFLELDAAGTGASPAAEAALAKLVADHPESDLWGEGLFLLGEARFRRGAFDAAAADLERLRRERPKHAVLSKALFRLGLCYAELGDWQRCDATLTELLKREPQFENLAEAELARGRALGELGRARPARQALARVLALAGDSVLGARAHLALGRLARAERDDEAALAEYLKVAVLYAAEPEVAEALYRAGDVLADQGKAEQARDRWREAAAHPNTEFGAQAVRRLAEVAGR
jgi:tetratricopeptide (TPR) repeat protein